MRRKAKELGVELDSLPEAHRYRQNQNDGEDRSLGSGTKDAMKRLTRKPLELLASMVSRKGAGEDSSSASDDIVGAWPRKSPDVVVSEAEGSEKNHVVEVIREV